MSKLRIFNAQHEFDSRRLHQLSPKAKVVAPEPWRRRTVALTYKRRSDCRHNMKYVCIFQSLNDAERFYTGITDDLDARLAKHKVGAVTHTSKFRLLAHQELCRL